MTNDIELLRFIKESRGVRVYDVMKRFSIKRTAALYRLDQLSKLSLLDMQKDGKSNRYYVVEGNKVALFFKEKIEQLKSELRVYKEQSSIPLYKPRNQKLKLVFVNYYDLLPESRKTIEKRYNIIDYSDSQLYISPEEFIKRARPADVIVNNFATRQFTEAMLRQLPLLQYMHLSTHMYQYVDTGALRARGVHLSNIPFSYKSIAVLEYLVAQTFALLRSTTVAFEQVKSGVNEFRNFYGEQLRGKKAIILGIDESTKDVVTTLLGLGVAVAIYSENKVEDPAFYGVSHFATEKEVFETGDIFYIPWTGDERRHLGENLDKTFLNKISRPVYIISVFKHKKIDYGKLRELIYSGLIRGIALDFYPEIANEADRAMANNLLYLPGVLVTPDIGWYTRDSIKNMNKHTTDKLLAYAEGRDDYLII